jgi:hypothetical protein
MKIYMRFNPVFLNDVATWMYKYVTTQNLRMQRVELLQSL